ncbi:Cdc6/Cdc18 family protein [Halorientalis marina]|uniref:Cdc6/Cdc18 family protein n=1 Tax=Halorientalis marina TaxID=2931976 RepID=UPI001FF4F47A|nr:Cdc6/Cdc18 family protein [Halorientalis marina]
MIEDARVLREGFVPSDIIHRDGETNALTRVLDPVTAGTAADPVLVTGPSGAGKTTLTKFVVDRLRETALDVESVHVNCWQSYSHFRVVYKILEGLGKTIDVHRQSTPQDELLNRLAAYDGPPVIVTLDEADQLEEARVIYDLYRLDAFSFILVTNSEEELLSGLDERVRSRLQTAETIHFDRYTVDELTDILSDRATHGLAPEAIDREQLRRIADAAAGDARVELSILRSAARRADCQSAARITAEHIEAAIPEAKREVRSKNLDSLRQEQRHLLDILAEAGELSPSDLYDRYTDRVEDPRTKWTVRSWLQKLAHYNLVEAYGSGPNRTYRTRNVASPSIPPMACSTVASRFASVC